jgi:hypothetical protein
MNIMKCLHVLSIALIIGIASPVPAQDNQNPDSTRAVFLDSRPQEAQKGRRSRSRVRRPRPSTVIGLGYSLYLRDADGSPLRVDPARIFHNGDQLRLVLEPNTNGYLYVFHSQDDGKPKMIFPDWRLSGGRNRVKAHALYEVPSRRELNPEWRWFRFSGEPGTEQLYFIVTRVPLKGIPIGQDLVASCRAKTEGCVWRPPEEVWKKLTAKLSEPSHKSESSTFGQALAAVEDGAIKRDFGLPAGAPEPSVVRVSVASSAGMLVMGVALTHR